MRNVLCLLVLTFGLVFHSLALSSGSDNFSEGLKPEKKPVPKRILAIFAFKQALPWAYQVEESMRAAIAAEAPFPIELNVEHADRARYPEETYLGKVVRLE